MSSPDHFDVLIVGAGLSGIGAAYHLQDKCPRRTYAVLEGRGAIGGTWDLFRYPGIRSDSDMHTLGYTFKPWTNAKAIADGPSILAYVKETAREYGIDAQHPLRALGEARGVVERDRALDGRGRARRSARAGALHLQLPVHVQRLLTTTRAATRPSSPGASDFRGRDRAPAAVDATTSTTRASAWS